MGLTLQISLGDVLVTASIVTSTYLAYQAFKGMLATIVAQLTTINTRVDKQAKRLIAQDKTQKLHGQKIATLEGAVFGRRASDQQPDPDDVNNDEL